MVTNYNQYDKVKGREVWAVPICLALAAGLLWGIAKYGNDHNPNFSHYNPSPEIRAVQSQESVKGLEGLTKTREKWRGK